MMPPRSAARPRAARGSTAIICIAVSWSVARIRPISEVSAVPARPANSSAVTTGPSSFSRPNAAATPSALSEPKALQQVEALQAQHHADEQAAQHDDDQRARAGVVDLVNDQARAPQRGDALREQGASKNANRADATQRRNEVAFS